MTRKPVHDFDAHVVEAGSTWSTYLVGETPVQGQNRSRQNYI
jgi:hypothetical protein